MLAPFNFKTMTKRELIIEIEQIMTLKGEDYTDGEVLDKIYELLAKEKNKTKKS